VSPARTADPKRFFVLLLVTLLAIALAFAAIDLAIQITGSSPLPRWPKRLADFVSFVWIWKITGMYSVLRLRERLGLRWLL
jgi:hypothetical protein